MTLKELCKESPFVLDSEAAFYIAARCEVSNEMMKIPNLLDITDETELNSLRDQIWAEKLREAYKLITWT